MKNRDNKNTNEKLDKRRYKKGYVLRRHQENEADREIKEFIDPEEHSNIDRTDDVPGRSVASSKHIP